MYKNVHVCSGWWYACFLIKKKNAEK
jgi:hypothetical protein